VQIPLTIENFKNPRAQVFNEYIKKYCSQQFVQNGSFSKTKGQKTSFITRLNKGNSFGPVSFILLNKNFLCEVILRCLEKGNGLTRFRHSPTRGKILKGGSSSKV
jgi:hypothetical protein